jgi:hypothetical protein
LCAQSLSIGWRPVLGYVLQSASDLFLGVRHRGGYLGHPLPERYPLLLEAMRLLLMARTRHDAS